MRILIVTQYFWPENFRINDLAFAFADRGHVIDVLTGMPNYPGGKLFDGYGPFRPAYENHADVNIIRVPLIPRKKGRGLELFLNYISFALAGSLIGPLRCTGEYDCILVFEPSPITVGLPAVTLRALKGIPVLFWVQDLWPESLSATGAISSRLILAWVKIFVRFIYRFSDRILVQSEAFIPNIRALGVTTDKLVYYPNSAEALFRPMALERNAAEREKVPAGFSLMFAGNIGAAQDFPTLLNAAENLKGYNDIHFVILGDGRRYSWLRSEVTSRGLQKTFHLLGRYPLESMPRFFSLADALLVSLRKDPIFELTIPSKVQSYMACARPILAALDGEGARVVKAAGAGLACGAENPGKLAKSILELYNMSSDSREQMGARGLAYFRANFERTLLVERLEKMMKDQRRTGT